MLNENSRVRDGVVTRFCVSKRTDVVTCADPQRRLTRVSAPTDAFIYGDTLLNFVGGYYLLGSDTIQPTRYPTVTKTGRTHCYCLGHAEGTARSAAMFRHSTTTPRPHALRDTLPEVAGEGLPRLRHAVWR